MQNLIAELAEEWQPEIVSEECRQFGLAPNAILDMQEPQDLSIESPLAMMDKSKTLDTTWIVSANQETFKISEEEPSSAIPTSEPNRAENVTFPFAAGPAAQALTEALPPSRAWSLPPAFGSVYKPERCRRADSLGQMSPRSLELNDRLYDPVRDRYSESSLVQVQVGCENMLPSPASSTDPSTRIGVFDDRDRSRPTELTPQPAHDSNLSPIFNEEMTSREAMAGASSPSRSIGPQSRRKRRYRRKRGDPWLKKSKSRRACLSLKGIFQDQGQLAQAPLQPQQPRRGGIKGRKKMPSQTNTSLKTAPVTRSARRRMEQQAVADTEGTQLIMLVMFVISPQPHVTLCLSPTFSLSVVAHARAFFLSLIRLTSFPKPTFLTLTLFTSPPSCTCYSSRALATSEVLHLHYTTHSNIGCDNIHPSSKYSDPQHWGHNRGILSTSPLVGPLLGCSSIFLSLLLTAMVPLSL